MKKVTVFLMCALTLGVFSSCNSKKSPGETAKTIHEKLKTQDYAGYVDGIYWEEFLIPVTIDASKPQEQRVQVAKQHQANVLKTAAQSTTAAKGGMKNIAVKSETVAPNGKTANVVLTNSYNNGTTEDVIYNMIYDEPTKKWKVKVGNDKEVWKTVLTDGSRESFKLKETDHKEALKTHMDGERDFLKEIDGENREVIKVKQDGEKEIHKVIEKENETVIKDKVNGEKEVTRISKE